MIKKTAIAAAALALSVTAAPAMATDWDLIDWNGQQVWGAEWTASTRLDWNASNAGLWYRVYFDGFTEDYMNGNLPLPGLASTVLYKLSSVGNNNKDWTFDYVVENASVDPVEEARVSGIGFDVVNPNPTSVKLAAGGEYRTVGRNGYFDAADDGFDVCFTTKGQFYSATNTSQNCDPGQNAGPELGETGSGTFTLKFANGRNTLAFTNPVVAYSGIEYDIPAAQTSRYGKFYSGHQHSYGCGHGGDENGWGTPVGYVPEPSTWAMMIVGFGAAGTILRRRRSLLAA